LIGPPTVLMGATIPMLTQVLSRDLEDASRLHAFVYATNTVGATAGFVLVPWLGLARVMFAMGAINLLAGAVFELLAAHAGAAISLAPEQAAPHRAGAAAYAFAALLVGRLRDDGDPDDREPARRALARRVGVHVRHRGGRERALHRTGQLRRGAPARAAARALVEPVAPVREPRRALLRARPGALLDAPAAPRVRQQRRRFLPLLPRMLRRGARRARAADLVLGRHALYAAYYEPHVGFSGEALLRAWAQCGPPAHSAGECRRGAESARALLEKGTAAARER